MPTLLANPTRIAAAALALGAQPLPPLPSRGEKDTPAPSGPALTVVEGRYSVSEAERGRRVLEPGRDLVVTMRRNVLSYHVGSTEYTLRLEFGPNRTVRAVGSGEGPGGQAGATGRDARESVTTGPAPRGVSYEGVYVVSKDYLCLSFNEVAPARAGAPGPAEPADVAGVQPGTPPPAPGATPAPAPRNPPAPAVAPGAAVPPQGADFVLILRRESGGQQPER
jgi:hypothetical protein